MPEWSDLHQARDIASKLREEPDRDITLKSHTFAELLEKYADVIEQQLKEQ